ncbi:hypothetical protein BREVNS_0917 [Brevinematales bacterium NS]|nr:hypothetical protein [Brevinematales bacterium]QJR21667.1 hypothetical protein BREVNS_0917 [Brevinematales bacterium NS]
MALLLELYDALRETVGDEKARKAVEDLENHIHQIKAEQATKSDIALILEQMDRRFELMEKRIEQVEKRFEHVERRFEQIDKRFDLMKEEMDRRFEQIERRFDFVQWLIVGVGGFISVLITLFQFLLRQL